MTIYVGLKQILARPMNRQEYNDYRGWILPEDENPNDPGYLVEYLDGGKSNHPEHAGYISWSPKEVFDNAYTHNGKLNFGYLQSSGRSSADIVKLGYKVTRSEAWDVYRVLENDDRGWINMLVNGEVSQYDYMPSSSDLNATDWAVL